MNAFFSKLFFGNRKSETSPDLCRSIENLKSVVALAVTFVLCGAVAHAQQTGKVPRIGFLDSSTASGSAVLVDAFRQELSKLGRIEGKNLTIEYRFAEQNLGPDRLRELAAELVRLKVDLIVVYRYPTGVSGKERHYNHPHRDGNRRGPCG